MNRRHFLRGAAGIGITAGLTARQAHAQGPAPATGRAAGPGRRGGGPAQVAPEKLARVAIMTLCFDAYFKTPWAASPTPEQTMTIFDLPKMYVDMYGVRNIEFQHSHLAAPNGSNGPVDGDPAVFAEIKARIAEQQCRMTQINLEFGEQNISTPDASKRREAVDRTKRWIDNAAMLGCPRVMLNQNQATLNKQTRAHTVAAWKELADYARTKKVTVSAETRGVVGASREELGMLPWEFLAGVIKDAGAWSNVDIGNVQAPNQQELNRAIQTLMATSAGSMHIKSSPNWDIGATIRFTEGLGYKGLYSLEVRTHQALRIVYNTVLANL